MGRAGERETSVLIDCFFFFFDAALDLYSLSLFFSFFFFPQGLQFTSPQFSGRVPHQSPVALRMKIKIMRTAKKK